MNPFIDHHSEMAGDNSDIDDRDRGSVIYTGSLSPRSAPAALSLPDIVVSPSDGEGTTMLILFQNKKITIYSFAIYKRAHPYFRQITTNTQRKTSCIKRR